MLEAALGNASDANGFVNGCANNFSASECRTWALDDIRLSNQFITTLQHAVVPAIDQRDTAAVIAALRHGIRADQTLARLCAAAKPGTNLSNDPALMNAVNTVDGIPQKELFPPLKRMDPNISGPE